MWFSGLALLTYILKHSNRENQRRLRQQSVEAERTEGFRARFFQLLLLEGDVGLGVRIFLGGRKPLNPKPLNPEP